MSNTTPLLTPTRKVIAGMQFLFVAFGATVLVPLLVGLDPSTALFSAGVGTLIFHLVTKGKVPIFLGSSFAFIAPIVSATKIYGLQGALFGLLGVGFVYFAISALIRAFGTKFISRLFPPVVIGPIIMLIGLSLAPAAVNMAKTNWLLALVALATAIVVTLYAKGMLKLIPIFLGIIVGYVADLLLQGVGLSDGIDFKPIAEAPWFALPQIHLPDTFSWEPILFMIPVAIAPVIEQVVSALAQPMSDSTFRSEYVKERNYMFHTAIGTAPLTEKNTISACVHTRQTVTDGQTVRFRLLEPMQVSGKEIPRNTSVVGVAKIQGERLNVLISSLEYHGNIIPVELAVYDTDGQAGIFIPGSMERSAAKEIVAGMGTSAGSSMNFSTDAGAQLAADLGKGLIQGTSQYFSKKMRTVKVHLKAGYKVLLYQPDNK